MMGSRHAPRGAFILGTVVAGLVLGAGCAPDFDAGGGEGPGHRRQYLGLSPEQEFALGKKAEAQVLAEARSKNLLRDDSPEQKRVREVGQRIAADIDNQLLLREINLRVDRRYLDWEYHVVDSKQINAFCLPGGRVFVFTGLLAVVKNDDQLATVMGHEIAHALAHHASERVAREGLEGTAGTALNLQQLGALDPGVMQRLLGALAPGALDLYEQQGGESLGSLAFDRAQESEADHIGVFLMTFAGYNPEQAVVFWERMMQANQGGHMPEILSDHPSDAHRIRDLEAWVPRAEGALRAYKAGHTAPDGGR